MDKIYFLYGSDYSSITTYINDLKEQVGNGNNLIIENQVLSKLDDIDFFFNKSLNLSLFQSFSFQIIDINLRAFNQLEKRTKEFVDFLKKYSAGKIIVIFLHVEKLDKATAKKISDSELFKSLKKISIFNEFNKLMPWQTELIKEKIIKSANKYNITFSQKALDLYIEHIKDNLNNLEHELKTLYLYLLPKNDVDEDSVGVLFKVGMNTDDLFDAIVGHTMVSVSRLNLLLTKFDSPLYIIAVLQNKFRQAFSVKVHLENNISIYQISKLLNINLYKLEKELNKFSTVSTEFLAVVISKLSELELKVKTGLINNKNIVDLLLIQNTYAFVE